METQKILLSKIQRIHNVDCIAYPDDIYLGYDGNESIIVPLSSEGKIVYENGDEKDFTMRVTFNDEYPPITDLFGEYIYFAGVRVRITKYDETIHELKKE